MTNDKTPKTCPHFKHLERHECSICSAADERKANLGKDSAPRGEESVPAGGAGETPAPKGGNPETISVGDGLTMTDLRRGESYPVVVEQVDADGRCIVRRTDNGARYNVHRGFLTVPK